VDIDDSVKEKQDKYQLIVDKEKAALAGISTEQIVQTLRMSVSGMAISTLHTPEAKNPISIFLRLPKGERERMSDNGQGVCLRVAGQPGVALLAREGDPFRKWTRHLSQEPCTRDLCLRKKWGHEARSTP